MRHLISELKSFDDERLWTFTTTNNYYVEYGFLGKDTYLENLDVMGCIEETLHRMLDAGWTDKEIYEYLGAAKFESMDELEYRNELGVEYTYIDLGYAIPGEILHIK